MHSEFVEIVKEAISNEEAAIQFYSEIATIVTNEDTRKTFLFLANEEKEHKALLEAYLIRREFPLIMKTEETELKELATLPSINKDMPPHVAIAIAINQEEKSYKFYTQLASLHPPGEIQDSLQKIATMELIHRKKIEKLREWFSRASEME